MDQSILQFNTVIVLSLLLFFASQGLLQYGYRNPYAVSFAKQMQILSVIMLFIVLAIGVIDALWNAI